MDAQAVEGKRILVTGAGGYIGSALARSLSTLPVDDLVLLDIAEHGLYEVDQELGPADSIPRKLVVGSISDRGLIDELFEKHQPQIIFHAAAHKHVPLMEANPFAAAETNVLGTHIMAEAAGQFKAEQFVLLSTDKAVDPISIMGASKRLAELIVLANASSTQMKVLRLCNILGSSGSVAPLFCRQVEQGSSVTVTHPEATRYFLSTAQSVQYLLATVSPAYSGGLYVPPVGTPYRIQALAQFLIDTISLADPRSEIVFTGLREGDKLHEKMLSSRESLMESERALTPVASSQVNSSHLMKSLHAINDALQRRDLARLLHATKAAVPEYSAGESLRSRIESARQKVL
jgi:FlaA1/EpsC-like NDP-sugar epimerase